MISSGHLGISDQPFAAHGPKEYTLTSVPTSRSKSPEHVHDGNSKGFDSGPNGADSKTPKSAQPPNSEASLPPPSTSYPESEQSLLEELFPDFPEISHAQRDPPPRLELPTVSPAASSPPPVKAKSKRDVMKEALQSRGEQITVLQLVHSSTELTEGDFRRLVPKGRHIDTWARDGEFYKVIPGRDPLSLERLPFYYLLFRNLESALAYQNNAARLHKLSTLHQPSNLFSAVAPPKGFLEDGEDVHAATSSYVLKPTSTALGLSVVVQPYNPSLRSLFEAGGYKPIIPTVVPSNNTKLYKVLLNIEGYEPTHEDLYASFKSHGYNLGVTWPLHNDHHAIHRLRDIIDLKARLAPISSINPRAAKSNRDDSLHVHDDNDLGATNDQLADAKELNQTIMNKVYNRWIIEFTEEEPARRFARLWHRRVLEVRTMKESWKDFEEKRIVNTEFLW
ncbi:hypothetical protein BS50DRAFT_493815 [Corynespora cassiicola Philippines]|uniref:Uncharacterized protein n=1 Tax=Corynespora cassiicola Philippines TaxID=1448308 RepID=A0A2T2NPT4_CORCC|nr:hypothetical protein BS50DRAFT_493815 [Corynespora cassiicola Philippines]